MKFDLVVILSSGTYVVENTPLSAEAKVPENGKVKAVKSINATSLRVENIGTFRVSIYSP